MPGLAAILSCAAAVLAAQTTTVASSTEIIRSAEIRRLNVFDPTIPGENIWPFRVANKIHFTSREHVIRRELLIKPGEPWDPLKALESERNIRSLGVYRTAEIRPHRAPDGSLAMIVRTQDSWTTNVQFSAGTEGGERFLAWGASENNLLGRGKALGFLHSELGSRRRNDLFYKDPRFFGSRFRLLPSYARTNHGDAINVPLTRPFFALDTPYAMSAGWNRTVDEFELFRDADDFSRFVSRPRAAWGSFGVRLPEDRYFVQRLETGWYWEKNRFAATSDTVSGTLPQNRELSGPVFGYSWVEPRYVKLTYIDKMERVEDFNLGNELKAYAGFMGEAAGSDRDRLIFNVVDQQGLAIGQDRFFLAQAGLSGRTARGKWDNALLYANINLVNKTTWLYPQTWVSHLEVNDGRNLDGENQIILGGNSGLRGYKNNSFTGARSVLLNFENRFFFPGEYWHLMRFGGAIFFDSGAVVPQRSGFSFKRFSSDVGAGFRVSSTRSRSGGVLRIDLAYALNDGPGRGRWVVSVRGGQAFEIFNSSTRRVRQSPASPLVATE